jgi:hypothetical protein
VNAFGLPFYTIHKIMAGMLDMYRLAANKQALDVVEGMAAWADTWSASKPEDAMGDLGGNGLTRAHIIGPNLRVGAPNSEQYGSALASQNRTPPVPDLEIPTFQAASEPALWIKPDDGPLAFRTTGQKTDVRLVPLSTLFDRRYSVYWTVS